MLYKSIDLLLNDGTQNWKWFGNDWSSNIEVIVTIQLYSKHSEIKYREGSNPVCVVLEVSDGECL